MRQTILAGNWKMNLNLKQATELAEGLKAGLQSKKTNHKVMVFPSSVHLPKVSEILKGTAIEVGAQNIYPSNLAAFTGEICPDQLKDFGISTSLLGHSERRQFLKETNEILNQKIHFCLKQNVKVMYCIGETLEEREKSRTFEVVKTQIIDGLKNVSSSDMTNIIIAYEPVWAIGTGKVATPEQAQEVHAYIRGELKSVFSKEIADKTIILYGGSVKPDNVKSLLDCPDIDGGLVGGASQKTDSFLALL